MTVAEIADDGHVPICGSISFGCEPSGPAKAAARLGARDTRRSGGMAGALYRLFRATRQSVLGNHHRAGRCGPGTACAVLQGQWRILGTIVGAVAMVTLMAAFPQQPVLFMAGVAVWLGIFHLYRKPAAGFPSLWRCAGRPYRFAYCIWPDRTARNHYLRCIRSGFRRNDRCVVDCPCLTHLSPRHRRR